MSISNDIIMGILRVAGYIRPPLKDVEEIHAHAKAHNEKQVFSVPKDGNIIYEDIGIHTGKGSHHCLRMKKKGSMPDTAILYICGGGGVYDYCRHQLVLARKLLRRVDAEIYYPFYPPSTKHPIKEAYKMIFETYRTMLDAYSHEKIGVLGISFGGTAAMTMISWNNHYEENLPMPALTICLSPGHVPANEEERKMLEAYRGVDPFIPVEQVEAYGRINEGDEPLEHWLIHTAHGDFGDAGRIHLYFGEKESLVYAEPVYREALQRAGTNHRIHREPGMPHCYGIGRINKASRRTYDEIVDLLNGL